MSEPELAEDSAEECPSWHWLPGPFPLDGGRLKCPRQETHAAQRDAYRAWLRLRAQRRTPPRVPGLGR